MRRFWLTAMGLVLSLALGTMGHSGEKSDVSVFNGKDLTGWKLRGKEEKNKWKVGTAAVTDKGALVYKEGGSDMVNTAGGGIDIYTEKEFGDCTVDIEVMVPKGSNSGVYLMGRYEVQVLDSFGRDKLGMGDMGAIYSYAVPKLNACKPPGEWQKFVIDFQAPRFDGKKKIANGKFLKVELNGKLIQENVELTKGPTGGALGAEVPAGPLMLQGDHGPVAFRHILVTPKK